MAPPRLHLDADASLRALHTALVARGHAVTRTPNTWMLRDASDTEQLLRAEYSLRSMCVIFQGLCDTIPITVG
jgi:hypothetical protein